MIKNILFSPSFLLTIFVLAAFFLVFSPDKKKKAPPKKISRADVKPSAKRRCADPDCHEAHPLFKDKDDIYCTVCADKPIETRICTDCHCLFVLKQGEKAFYEKRKLPLPRRCFACRSAKKAGRPTITL